MTNHNYICFDCKITRRYSNWFSLHLCNICGGKLIFSHAQFKIPKKNDNASWKKLKPVIIKFNRNLIKGVILSYKKKIKELKDEINLIDKRNLNHVSGLQNKLECHEKDLEKAYSW